ncbi:MAG TPA: ABC transporter ATP-binding protein [Solirubrobacteraceae bacterium]|nr:ABC transporter ATP-binding protein [Solirubrobacteraceae bacterium]
MLELRGLVKHYAIGSEIVRAVDNVSLDVLPGELVGLYGPSGSGKTTLLQITASVIQPDRGVVMFNGREVSRLTASAAAAYRLRDVGIVFQSFHLIRGASALENASLKLLADGHSMREAYPRAAEWLERVGLGSRMGHKPDQLSTGERQRVAIARALVNDPRLLVADEPTGNLDSKRSSEILALLSDVCTERAIPGLLVTHDPQASAHVSRVATLRDGRLREGLDSDLELAGQ